MCNEAAVGVAIAPYLRARTNPGKSWNFIVQNSRPWKVLEKGIGPGKSWKVLELLTSGSGIFSSGLSSR